MKPNEVVVISSYPLSQEDMNLVKSKFPQYAQSTFVNNVDKSILAGVIIRQGSMIIDLSVKTHLQSLRSILYESI